MLGVMLVVLLPAILIADTALKYRRLTGRYMFSAFSGWQLASNALFAYTHLPKDRTDGLPGELIPLHDVVNRHMDSLRTLRNRPDSLLNVYYLWNEASPLRVFMHKKYINDKDEDNLKRLALMSGLYEEYGLLMIKRHPGAFFRYYLFPNLMNYFVPNPEFLGVYNMEKDYIEPAAVSWFKLKNNNIIAG